MEDDRAEVDLGIAADIEASQAPEPVVKQPKKRFVGRRTAAEASSKNSTGSAIEDAGAIQGMFLILSSAKDLLILGSGPTKKGAQAPESSTSRDLERSGTQVSPVSAPGKLFL